MRDDNPFKVLQVENEDICEYRIVVNAILTRPALKH